MNNHDSEKIAGVLRENGYGLEVSEYLDADIVVFNTCCVRQNADDRFYGNLSLLKPIKELRPDMLIAVSGCIAQRDKEAVIEKAPFVDIVFGANNIHELPDMVKNKSKNDFNESIKTDEISSVTPYDMPSFRKEKTRAWVPVSIGCDNFCTYCIVPHVRGRERSIAPDVIIKAANELAEEGAVEITLLGQNVNSYGNDLGFEKGLGFSKLLNELNSVEGIKRIRFTTSHPKDLCDETIDAMAKLDKVCEHLHLPVQCGSNRILKKMNRKYTREQYINTIESVRKLIPGCAISTDIIVGFPGETEEDFKETLELIEDCSFDAAYTFIYSPRDKTAAAKYEDNVTPEEKQRRFERLVEAVNHHALLQNKKLLGTAEEVFVESVSKKDSSMLKARTRSNKLVHFKGNPDLIDKFCDVTIREAKTWHLSGDLLKPSLSEAERAYG